MIFNRTLIKAVLCQCCANLVFNLRPFNRISIALRCPSGDHRIQYHECTICETRECVSMKLYSALQTCGERAVACAHVSTYNQLKASFPTVSVWRRSLYWIRFRFIFDDFKCYESKMTSLCDVAELKEHLDRYLVPHTYRFLCNSDRFNAFSFIFFSVCFAHSNTLGQMCCTNALKAVLVFSANV